MTGRWNRRIDERDQGWRLLNRLTGAIATAAVAAAGVFGLALARHDRPSATPVDQNQVTNGTGDTGGGVIGTQDFGGGGLIVPPAQPPTGTGGQGHVSSGGS